MNNKIKHFRENAGLSQEELAKRANVSRATLSGLESGRVDVTTTATLEKIASALSKNVSDFFNQKV